jgi:hypothetical protein
MMSSFEVRISAFYSPNQAPQSQRIALKANGWVGLQLRRIEKMRPDHWNESAEIS